MKTLKFLFAFILFSLAFAGCEKEDFTETLKEEITQDVDFRDVSDYVGIWKFGFPAKYIDVSTDGSYVEVLKLGATFNVKAGGVTGWFTEIGSGAVNITGIYNDNDWILINTIPYWRLEINTPQYIVITRIQ